MGRRRVGFVAVALLLALVSVQVVDPRVEDRQPPEVDFSDPPAEVAADAAERFEYVDYAYRFEITDRTEPEWRQVREMTVDNSDREFYKEGPLGDRGVIMYGTDAVTFVRPGMDEPWRVTGMRDVIYPARVISQPFRVERVRHANATVIDENSSTITIGIDAHPAKVSPLSSGNATVVVAKNTGLIKYANIHYRVPHGWKHLRFILLDRDIDLQRPDDVSLTAREVFWDVVRGPLISL